MGTAISEADTQWSSKACIHRNVLCRYFSGCDSLYSRLDFLTLLVVHLKTWDTACAAMPTVTTLSSPSQVLLRIPCLSRTPGPLRMPREQKKTGR